MNLFEAEVMAKDLISTHVPHYIKFEWMRRKTAFGDYSHYYRRIRLSTALIPFCTEQETREIIMHEIAHALTPGDNHGYYWRKKMRELGEYPNKTKRIQASTDSLAKWKGVCPAGHNCGTWLRKPSAVKSCTQCSPKFDTRHQIVYVRI